MLNNSALETIPEETGLPRIQKLIPKSPETRKREQESQQQFEKYSNDKSLEHFYELLVMNSSINRICLSDKFSFARPVRSVNIDARFKRKSCPPNMWNGKQVLSQLSAPIW